MAEGVEAGSDALAYAASLGYVVSAAQLARWHRAGLLPRPRQQPLGRGRGTATVYPAGTTAQLVALCQMKADERRLDRLAFRLWWDGFSIDLAVIRGLLEAHARTLDTEIRQGRDVPPSVGAKPRGMARASQAALSTIVNSQLGSGGASQALLAWDMRSGPPSLEDLGSLMGQVMAAQIEESRSLQAFVGEASDDDLARARDRARTLLSFVLGILGPMVWLYGRRASVFKAMGRMLSGLSPSDFIGLVLMLLISAPHMEPEVLASIDVGAEPALAVELRQLLTIRDQVSGAAQMITPKVIRAFLLGSDSACYYVPSIEKFAADHRQEIDSVLNTFSTAPGDSERSGPAVRADHGTS